MRLSLDPAYGSGSTFTLTITRRVFAVDAITGVKTGYYVRNWNIV